MEISEIAELEFYSSDLGELLTIREYLKTLLKTLWIEGEGFSGKRPFGNSGWQFDLYLPLIAAGVVKGKLDDEGFIEEVDEKAASNIIKQVIETL